MPLLAEITSSIVGGGTNYSFIEILLNSYTRKLLGWIRR